MNRKTVHDSEVSNLVWREKAAGGWVAVFRSLVDGRDKWETLKGVVVFSESDKREVRKIIRDKRAAVGLAGLRERLNGGAQAAEKVFSSLRELEAAYLEFAPGAERLSMATARANLRAMRYVMARTQAKPFETLRADVFTEALPADLAAAMLSERRAGIAAAKLCREDAEREEERVMVSMAGQWRFCMSIFSRKAMASAPMRKLALPDMEPLRAIKIGASSKKDYEPWPDAVVAAVKAGVRGLQQTDPDLWLVAQLEMNADLRKSSAAHARWDWFGREGVDDAGRPSVQFFTKVAKGGRSNFAFPLERYREMRMLGMDRLYILPGEDLREREALIARLVAKLRGWGLNRPPDLNGVQRDKPNHELRKICTHETAAALGDDEAMARTGHSDVDMLGPYRQRQGRRVHCVV